MYGNPTSTYNVISVEY